MPPVKIQTMLKTVARQPVLPGVLTIVFPKGTRLSIASLNSCMPKGMPTIVAHMATPPRTYSRKIRKPPKMIQRILPIRLNVSPSFLPYLIAGHHLVNLVPGTKLTKKRAA